MDGEQRIAAEFEKIVVRANWRPIQRLLPYAGELLLKLIRIIGE